MAKIIIQNTREHDISLSFITESGEIAVATVPAGYQDPDDRSKFIHGEAEVESELMEVAIKKSPVVAHYIEEGWLREKKVKAVADKKGTAKAPEAPGVESPWKQAK